MGQPPRPESASLHHHLYLTQAVLPSCALSPRGAALPSTLPAGLEDALRERCANLAALASGSVFEVPLPSRSSSITAALRSRAADGERYDTVVSVTRTPFVDDMDAYLSSLGRLLAPDGWLLMIEPSGEASRSAFSSRLTDLRRLGLASAGTVLRRLRGGQDDEPALRSGRADEPAARLDHDPVASLWANGYAVTDIHRFEVPSAPAAWRPFVDLRARRATPSRSRSKPEP